MPASTGPLRAVDGAPRPGALAECQRSWERGKLVGWLRAMRRRRVGGETARIVLEDLATRIPWATTHAHVAGRSDAEVTVRQIAWATGLGAREVRRAVAALKRDGWAWWDDAGRVWVGYP